jgi:hypothetical protein
MNFLPTYAAISPAYTEIVEFELSLWQRLRCRSILWFSNESVFSPGA